jgi:hypothetical protein
MSRVLKVLAATTLVLALTATSAFAQASGQGPLSSDDKTVTNFAFAVIGFFPLFVLCASLIQWQLEKRKERKDHAAKQIRTETESVWNGGW